MRRRTLLRAVPSAMVFAGCSGRPREGWIEAVPVSDPPDGADLVSFVFHHERKTAIRVELDDDGELALETEPVSRMLDLS